MACEGCSHCRDLKSSSWDDPEQVRAVKAEAGQRLSAWIDGARGGAAAAAQGRGVPVQQQQQAQNVLQNVLQPLGWPGGGIRHTI